MIERDDEGWFWVNCPCGYSQGPFDAADDADDDALEHFHDDRQVKGGA